MKKQFAQAALFKALFAVTLILAASLLVTCDGFLDTLQPEGDVEYTDVEYEVVGAVGNQRVKSLTLYLRPEGVDEDALPGPKTYGVKKSAEQRAIERALTLEGARMSHDYFEVVFMASATAVARAAWEIGQPAGIAGVSRNSTTNFSTPAPGTATATGSIIFVGRKTGKTLMGVGYLSHIEDIPIASTTSPLITQNTTKVTFTVSPLATWVGFVGVGTPPADIAPWSVNTKRPDVGAVTAGVITPHETNIATFVTATAGGVTGGNYSTLVTTGQIGGEMYSPFAGIRFPMYYLPSAKAAGWPTGNATDTFTVTARYTVGGLTAATVYTGDAIYTTPNPAFPTAGLTGAVFVWGKLDGAGGYPPATPVAGNSLTATSDLRGGLQFIKRTPAFIYEGVNYELNSTIDKVTKITQTALTPDNAFSGELDVTFTVTKGASGGIFAITFQCPVYALTPIRASNIGTLAPEKWFIRPDYGLYQYLLDDGKNSGGAVLLGVDVAGGADWIQINTVGIGFSNE